MRARGLAAIASLVAAASAPAVAHASVPPPQVAHCVVVGPVYVFGQVVIGTYELCVPA
jgi:hypothetical protein